MKMRRLLALALSTTLLMTTLIGCTDKEDDTSKGEIKPAVEGETGKDPLTLTYAFWNADQEPMMRAMADEYESQNEHITVEFQITPWDEYWPKLEASAIGEGMPDVMWMHGNVIDSYVENDMLLAIEEDDVFKYSNYPENIKNIYYKNDSLYAVPKDYDTIALYYNKELFDAAGLDYPTAEWTWDDLVVAALALTTDDVYGFGAPQTNHQGYYSLIYQNGGEVLNTDKTASGFDNPKTIEAIQLYYDMIFTHKVSPTPQQFADNELRTYFENGQVAMGFMGSWSLGAINNNENISGKFDVAELPKIKSQATITNGLGHGVAANSENPEEAIAFAKFLGSKEANEIQGSFGQVIPAFLGTESTWSDNYPEYNAQAIADSVSYAVVLPATSSKAQWEKSEKDIMRGIYAGEIDLEEGCTQIAEAMNEAISGE